MADLEAVLADVSYLMAMEKSKSTPAARASKKITLPEPRYRPPRRGPGPAPGALPGPDITVRPCPGSRGLRRHRLRPWRARGRAVWAGCVGCVECVCLFGTTCAGSLGG